MDVLQLGPPMLWQEALKDGNAPVAAHGPVPLAGAGRVLLEDDTWDAGLVLLSV